MQVGNSVVIGMQELESSQVEQLKKIAGQLLELRQKQSVKLEQVATATYIPLRLLQALEDLQLERLPEPVYIQGFIRRYADFLGLDGMSLAKEFSISPPRLDLDPNPIAAAPDRTPAPPPLAIDSMPKKAVVDSVPAVASVDPASDPVSQTVSEDVILPGVSVVGGTATVSDPAVTDQAEPLPSSLADPVEVLPVSDVAAVASSLASPMASASSVPPDQSLGLPEPVAMTAERVPAPTASGPVTPPAPQPPSSSRATSAASLPWIPILGGLAVLIVGGLAIAAFNQPKSQQAATQTSEIEPRNDTSAGVKSASPKTETDPDSPSGQTAKGESSQSSATNPSSPSDANAPVQVAAKLTDDSWLSVKADGDLIYEGTLPKGSQKTWSAQKDLVIVSGNAGAVMLSFNQEKAKPMGARGQVETETFTLDAAKTP